MIDSVMGLPVHALIVHLAVVATPIAALLSMVHAWWPAKRPVLLWPTAIAIALSVVSVVTAAATGPPLRDAMFEAGLIADTETIRNVADHADIGGVTQNVIVLYALVAGGFLLLASSRGPSLSKAWAPVACVIVTVMAISALGAVIAAGHSGAAATWSHVGL